MTDKIIIPAKPEVSKSDENKFVDELKKTGTKAGKASSKSFSTSFTKDIAVGNLIASGVSKAVGALSNKLRQSVQDLRDFSRGVAEVNSILPANQKLTRESEKALIAFSSQFATGAQTQAQAFYNIVSAGVKGTANQLRTLEVANKAATAGLVDIDSAAKLLVSSVNAYSQSGLTAEQASDALFVAVREGQTTFGELASTVGNVTGIAASAGVKFSELTGSIAAFTKQGLSTETAVVGLRQALVSVVKPTKQASDEAKRIGLQFDTAAIKSKGLAGFLKEVQQRTGGNSQSLAKLFGNVRALTPVLTTVNGNFAEFERILKETSNAAGATGVAFQTIAKNFDFQLKKRAQEIRNLFLIVGQTFKQTFASLVTQNNITIGSIQKGLISVTRFINNYLVAPFELFFNGMRVGWNAVVVFLTQGIATFVGGASRLLAGLLEKFNVGEKLSSGLRSFAETSQLVADEAFGDLKKSADKIFEGTAFGKGEEFLTNLENNLSEAKTLIDQSGVGAALGGTDEGGESTTTKKTEEINALSAAFQGMGQGFTSTAESADAALKNLSKRAVAAGKQMRQGLANGIAQGFAAFGAAIAKGENALSAFVKSFLGAIGQMAIQQGAFFILEGIGLSFTPGLQDKGPPLIAAGAALATLGGALTAVAGGGGAAGAAAGAGGGGVSSIDSDTETPTEQTEEREQQQSSVTVQVQGDILDSEDTGTRLAEILRSSLDRDGIAVGGGSFA